MVNVIVAADKPFTGKIIVSAKVPALLTFAAIFCTELSSGVNTPFNNANVPFVFVPVTATFKPSNVGIVASFVIFNTIFAN